jgi:hypothetical protein
MSDMLLASPSLAIACGLVLVRLIASLWKEKSAGAMRDARLDAAFHDPVATHYREIPMKYGLLCCVK